MSTFLNSSEIEQYHRDGYLVREELLTQEQVKAVRKALSTMIQRYAHDREATVLFRPKETDNMGGVQIRKKDSRFFFQLETGQEPDLDDLEVLEEQVRKFVWFEDEEPIFREILDAKGPMAEIVRELIADQELLYQTMALIKPARIGSTKPWHQDNAYFSVNPLQSICGVWIAIDEATVENGCMHMLRGGHNQGAHVHEHRRDCEINVSKLNLSDLVPLPLKPGSALFFSGMVPHMTPPNRSDKRRRALQFHFRGSQSEILPGPEYDQLFKDRDGNPASCEAVRRSEI